MERTGHLQGNTHRNSKKQNTNSRNTQNTGPSDTDTCSLCTWCIMSACLLTTTLNSQRNHLKLVVCASDEHFACLLTGLRECSAIWHLQIVHLMHVRMSTDHKMQCNLTLAACAYDTYVLLKIRYSAIWHLQFQVCASDVCLYTYWLQDKAVHFDTCSLCASVFACLLARTCMQCDLTLVL